MKLRLGVLDQSPIRSGGTAKEALEDSVRLARLTESLGYERYWVAEHHGSNSFAGSSPELLISRIAAETSRMRVGSGGVMLPHYSPYKVAENFRLLETMYPGRIDLGIGRAPGSDMVTAQALAYGSPVGIEYFANKVIDLQALVKGEAPTTKGLESVVATPRADTVPEMWLLGSSEQSAMYAAHFGLPYSFAHFIAPDQSQACVARYQELCQQAQIPARANLGVFVICAETEAKAQQLALCRDLWRLRFEKGDPGPCPSIAEAEAFEFTDAERARLDQRNKHTIAGTPDEVRARLESLAADHGVEELVVVTICHEFADRARSYELLAEALQLPVAA
jgi:luciferase family oxidoreductase group 1